MSWRLSAAASRRYLQDEAEKSRIPAPFFDGVVLDPMPPDGLAGAFSEINELTLTKP
jgi:hypothetical protein